MSNYEKIKNLIEKKKLSQGLLLALSNSLKIKLVTRTKEKEQFNNIETDIDLVKGLITEINDKSCLSANNYILNFHKKQLENIYDTWDKNRETLVKIFQIINGSSIKLNSSLYSADNFIESKESDDNFEHEFNDFESESPLENSFFEEENPLNEEEDNHHREEEIPENWIDNLEDESDSDNDIENIENSFPEEEDKENSFEMMIEEDIFMSNNDEGETESSEEEDWDDFMVEMPEEEAIVSPVIATDDEETSPDVEIDDDWEEWLDEDNLPTHDNDEYTPEAMDWSEEN